VRTFVVELVVGAAQHRAGGIRLVLRFSKGIVRQPYRKHHHTFGF
jgi:hypothetical protein